jgi:hypothetical protein
LVWFVCLCFVLRAFARVDVFNCVAHSYPQLKLNQRRTPHRSA